MFTTFIYLKEVNVSTMDNVVRVKQVLSDQQTLKEGVE